MNFKKFWEKHGSQAALVFICLCFILIVGTGGKNLLERYKTNAQITNALNEADASKTVHVYIRGSAVSEGGFDFARRFYGGGCNKSGGRTCRRCRRKRN